MADTRLALARLALAEKNYDKALSEVEAGKAFFSDPYQQAIALYCIAQAKDAKLSQKPEAGELKDVAIDYIRVVALSQKTSEQPYIAESLYRAAQLLQRCGDTKGAIALFADVAQSHADTPLGKTAASDLAKLQKTTEGADGK